CFFLSVLVIFAVDLSLEPLEAEAVLDLEGVTGSSAIFLYFVFAFGGFALVATTTEYQLADMFTKALPEERFQYLVRRIGMRCLTPAELEVLTKESA
ncbi:hypothetical protein Tco_1013311, partial [Tanacetum coccineum]